MKRKITFDLIVFVLGLGLLTGGLWMIYPPAGLIAAGLVLMVISVFGEGQGGQEQPR